MQAEVVHDDFYDWCFVAEDSPTPIRMHLCVKNYDQQREPDAPHSIWLGTLKKVDEIYWHVRCEYLQSTPRV